MSPARIAKAITTAFHWHGGGESPLYQFASTRRVHGPDHRKRLKAEIHDCFGNSESVADTAALVHLWRVIARPIKLDELMTFDEYKLLRFGRLTT